MCGHPSFYTMEVVRHIPQLRPHISRDRLPVVQLHVCLKCGIVLMDPHAAAVAAEQDAEARLAETGYEKETRPTWRPRGDEMHASMDFFLPLPPLFDKDKL